MTAGRSKGSGPGSMPPCFLLFAFCSRCGFCAALLPRLRPGSCPREIYSQYGGRLPGAGVSGWYAPRFLCSSFVQCVSFRFFSVLLFSSVRPCKAFLWFPAKRADRRPGRARSGRRKNGGASPGHSGRKRTFANYSRRLFSLRFLSASFVVIGRGLCAPVSGFLLIPCPLAYPPRQKETRGPCTSCAFSHLQKILFFKKFSRRRRVHWLPAPGLPFGSSAGPPPSRSGPCLLWRCRRPGRRRFPSLRAPILLCAPLCGVLYFCRKKQGRRLQKPRAVAQKEKRGRSRSFTCFNLLATCTASPLDVPGLPVLLLPSCFNACIGCGKSPAFCSGNSPGCPRFVPSLCEKSALSFWSAAPCGFRSSSPGFLYRKLSRQGPAVAVPVRLLRVRFSMCPGGAGCPGCQAVKALEKLPCFCSENSPGIICAAQLLREKPALNFSSVPL